MGFEIIMQERWTYLNAQSNPVDGYRITFRMDDGTVDHVLLREGELEPEAVMDRIADKIARHQAIAQLGGTFGV